jgi:SAM-dependent methyltransferase
MRLSIKKFAHICAKTLPISEPIYEFGALQVPGQEGFADLRPLFPAKKYVGADIREGTGVDVILDIQHIDLPSESVGTVLVLDTLEHVEFPREAIQETHRILKPNGIIIISSVMNYHIHDYPADYWRFTPEGFKSMLKPFSHSFIGFTGSSLSPITVVGIGFKGTVPENALNEFMKMFHRWRRGDWRLIVKLLAPPILLDWYLKRVGV